VAHHGVLAVARTGEPGSMLLTRRGAGDPERVYAVLSAAGGEPTHWQALWNDLLNLVVRSNSIWAGRRTERRCGGLHILRMCGSEMRNKTLRKRHSTPIIDSYITRGWVCTMSWRRACCHSASQIKRKALYVGECDDG